MIKNIGQIMLYVNNQDESKNFWIEKLGFTLLAEVENEHGMKWFELTPTEHSETSIILHDKKIIKKMSPELHLGTPSLMFYSDNFDTFYQDLAKNKVTLGEIVTMPTGRIFNFADNENNYFAVMEVK